MYFSFWVNSVMNKYKMCLSEAMRLIMTHMAAIVRVCHEGVTHGASFELPEGVRLGLLRN